MSFLFARCRHNLDLHSFPTRRSSDLNNRQTTTSQNSLYNPTYNTNWSGAYTQPLLRGFSTDITRQSLQVTRINRSEEHTSELQSLTNLVCRLLLEKKKQITKPHTLRH